MTYECTPARAHDRATTPSSPPRPKLVEWVGADRSRLGDTHNADLVTRDDAWFAVHVVRRAASQTGGRDASQLSLSRHAAGRAAVTARDREGPPRRGQALATTSASPAGCPPITDGCVAYTGGRHIGFCHPGAAMGGLADRVPGRPRPPADRGTARTARCLRPSPVERTDDGAGRAVSRPACVRTDLNGARPARRALADCLIRFARQTGSQLVAEGIEHASDLATWAELGADAAQGFHLGRPGALPAPPFCRQLQAHGAQIIVLPEDAPTEGSSPESASLWTRPPTRPHASSKPSSSRASSRMASSPPTDRGPVAGGDYHRTVGRCRRQGPARRRQARWSGSWGTDSPQRTDRRSGPARPKCSAPGARGGRPRRSTSSTRGEEEPGVPRQNCRSSSSSDRRRRAGAGS